MDKHPLRPPLQGVNFFTTAICYYEGTFLLSGHFFIKWALFLSHNNGSTELAGMGVQWD